MEHLDHLDKPIVITPSEYPLTIELVPKNAWDHNLRALIPASQWDRIRNAVFEQASNRCEICGGYGWSHPVECHERWTFNEPKRLQTLDGLIALCPRCHAVKHLGFTMKNRRPESFQTARQHLMRVNGITGAEADKYIEWAFGIQRARAKMMFVMDLSWLSRHFQFSWSKKALQSTALIRGDA